MLLYRTIPLLLLFSLLHGYTIRTIGIKDLDDALTLNIVFRTEYEIPHIYKTLYRNLQQPTISSAHNTVKAQLEKDEQDFRSITSNLSQNQFLIGAFEHESHSCFALLQGERHESVLIIRHIAVFKQMRNKGIERALVSHIINTFTPEVTIIQLWYTDETIRMELENERLGFEFSSNLPAQCKKFFNTNPEQKLYIFGILSKEANSNT